MQIVPIRGRGILAVGVLAALSGCAPFGLAPAPSVSYQCEDGHDFRLTVAPSGDSAIIEISGMRFSLAAEPPRGSGERYECSELGVWREGDVASLRMGQPGFTNCRLKP